MPAPISEQLLPGGTRHVAVGTEHAAITTQGAKCRATVLAVIEELAGIGRHRLNGDAVALGTCDL